VSSGSFNDDQWAHGPPFLLGPQNEWPVAVPAERPTLELRAKALLIQSPYVDIITGSRYAHSFSSLQRVFAYVHKFCHRLSHLAIIVDLLERAIFRSQWPIRGRKTVTTKALHKCIQCFRSKPRLLEHIMADLPEQRVNGCLLSHWCGFL